MIQLAAMMMQPAGGGFEAIEIVAGLGTSASPHVFAATPQDGDVIYVVAVSGVARATPAGWSLINSQSTSLGTAYCWMRTCGASETNSYPFGGPNTAVRSAAVVIRGAHSYLNSFVTDLAPSGPPSGPTVTVANGDCLINATDFSGASSITDTNFDVDAFLGARAAGGSSGLSAPSFAVQIQAGTPTRFDAMSLRVTAA